MNQNTTPARYLKLERLVEVSRLLGSALELEPFLQYIVDIACELILCEAASIFLFEEETGLLKFVAAPVEQRAALQRVRIPLDKSVAGTAYTQSRPVIVQDAIHEALVFREVDHVLNFETRSILAVPICFGSHSLGVVEAVNKHGNAHYTGEDLTILESLAGYAAVALFNTALLEESRLAEQEIEELERLKSDFIAITSHELRTPLGLVLGHAAILKEMLPSEEYTAQLDVILRSADRIQKLLDDMINTDLPPAGKGKIRRQPIALGQLIQDLCSNFIPVARQKRLSFVVQVPDSELLVEADPDKISLALGNLVENALQFTGEGGHVVVLAERLAGFVKVSVLDDGPGIPAKDLPHVFDRFFQVEAHATRRHSGVGLGLSVAKVMVEMHGGQIWAESIEGMGSKFSFLLPCGEKKSFVKPALQ